MAILRDEMRNMIKPIIHDQQKVWDENLLVPNIIGIFDEEESKQSSIAVTERSN